MRAVSFITIFLALGLSNANGTTLYCEGADLYIHKNGPTILVASKPSAGLEVEVSKVKLLSMVPELTFQAVLNVRDTRNICACEKQYAIQKSVSLFKNKYDRIWKLWPQPNWCGANGFRRATGDAKWS